MWLMDLIGCILIFDHIFWTRIIFFDHMVPELISTNFFTMNVPHMSHQVLRTLEDLVAVEALMYSSSAARLLHSLTSDVRENGCLVETLHFLQELEKTLHKSMNGTGEF